MKTMKAGKSILFISDMHIPYSHKDLVPFLETIKDTYEPDQIICGGDEVDCFPEDAEILTPNGFTSFREVIDNKLDTMQWHEDGTITSVHPEAYIDKPYDGELLKIENTSYVSITTPKHMIVKENPSTGKIHKREAWDTAGTHSWYIPRVGLRNGLGIELEDTAIQLQVAYQADGTNDKGDVKFEFSKQRKIDRLEDLLTSTDIPYNKRTTGRDTTVIYIQKANVPSYLNKVFDTSWINTLSLDQRNLFINELGYWDGTLTPVGIRYTSMIKENRDTVQAIACSAGFYTGKVTSTYLDIHLERSERTSQKSATFTNVPYKGQVCCVQVPTGMIIVRQNGSVTVSGNCHAMSFHDSDPDLLSAGSELESAIDMLQPIYELFPKMDLVDSNHGSMIYRKGKHHGIPRKYLREYGEILEAPEGWNWHDNIMLELPNKQQIFVTHGVKKKGLALAQQMGCNVVQFHYHTEFNTHFASSPNQLYWSMQCGCLIDDKSLAFHYNKTTAIRPIIGCGIVLEGQPMLLPMILDNKGRWIGELL